MAESIRIRAKMEGGVADVKARLSHPMETGLRRNDKGDLVPMHFIQSVVATLNGRVVLDAQCSQALSRNPFLGFRIRGAKAGDRIALAWIDNRGEKGSVESVVFA